MANISNILFEFTREIVDSSASGSALDGANIHADVYEEIRPGKTIRVDDLRTATPVTTPDGNTRRDNAVINLFFLSMPATQKLEDRLEARQMSEDMCDAWLAEVNKDPTLGNRICFVGEKKQFNDWIKPGTVKIPVTILRLLINPRKGSG